MGRIKFKCFSLFVLVLWAMMLIPAGYAASPTQPHLPRVGPNLVTNPTFSGTSHWSVSGGAQYDAAASRSADGSGSIRLPRGGRVDSPGALPVTPGKTYTFAAYIRTPAWPPGMVYMVFGVVNAGGGLPPLRRPKRGSGQWDPEYLARDRAHDHAGCHHAVYLGGDRAHVPRFRGQ
jgi:hypothetical protein